MKCSIFSNQSNLTRTVSISNISSCKKAGTIPWLRLREKAFNYSVSTLGTGTTGTGTVNFTVYTALPADITVYLH